MNKHTKQEKDTLQIGKSLLISIALLGYVLVCAAIGMGV